MASTKLDLGKGTITTQPEIADSIGPLGSLWYEGGTAVVDEVELGDNLSGKKTGGHSIELALNCSGGTQSCYLADLAVMGTSSSDCDVSSAWDDVASEATQKINLILQEAAQSRKDADLMLCDVGGGQIMLLWGTRGLPKGFTPLNDIKEIRRLLGVQPVKSADSWHESQEPTESA